MKRHYKCKYTIKKEKELIEYYKNGNSLSETGLKYSLSIAGVQKILKVYNIKRRTVSEAQKGVFYNTKDKFFNNLEKENDCLLWKGSTASGYGVTCFKGKRIAAHRLAYILTYGNIPENQQVLHSCDTPLCCNPQHLFLGTHQDNMKDREDKGRTGGVGSKGEKNPKSKLNKQNILDIRKIYKQGGLSQKLIGKQFGVDPSIISGIINRKIWKHI